MMKTQVAADFPIVGSVAVTWKGATNLTGRPLHVARPNSWFTKRTSSGVDLDAALRHHFSQVTIADAVLAVPAHAQQDDLDRKTTAFENQQQSGSIANRAGLQGTVNATVPSQRVPSRGWIKFQRDRSAVITSLPMSTALPAILPSWPA